MSSNFVLYGSIVLLAPVLYYHLSQFRKLSAHPPTPPAWPFVGYSFQVPTEKTWKYFEEIFKRYGPIYRLNLAGAEIIVLSDPVDAEELLERRSLNYSSRRPLIYAGKYQSKGKRFVMMPYDATFKKHRAAFNQIMQPRNLRAHEDLQEFESSKLLRNMLLDPEGWTRNIESFSASLIFRLNYGRTILEEDLNGVLSILDGLLKHSYPGSHLVDTFPILDRLPNFLSPWRAQALQNHAKEMKLYSRLALEVKERMEKGDTDLDCLASKLWDKQIELGLDLEEVSYILGVSFEAGSDTTSATLQWFILAMVLYPNILRGLQSAIDDIVGSDGSTIPGFEHIESMPYAAAVMKEVYRWAPCVPGGFPHYSDFDDEYKGYQIPAKTMVIPCIWNMHHNEEVFSDPYSFNPERYMDENPSADLTAGHYGFGFGRRKCPGRNLAAKSVWICATRLAWGFKIESDTDYTRNSVPVSPENCTSGVTSRPLDFPVRFTPRSGSHVQTMLAVHETV